MAYLQLAGGVPPFHKAVISVWVRFPAASVTAVRDRGDADPVFDRFLPLLTFGARQTRLTWTPTSEMVGSVLVTTGYTSEAQPDTEPCFIGLLTNTDSPTLWLNFQTSAYRTVAYGNELVSAVTADTQNMDLSFVHQADYAIEGSGWQPHYHADITNYNEPNTAAPEKFEIDTGIQLAPATWHHLLVSFDFSNTVSAVCSPTDTPYATSAEGISSFCKVWFAINDVNYSGADYMGGGFVDGQSDLNAVVPSYAINVAHYYTGLVENNFMHQTTYTLVPGELPTDTAPLGVPVSSGLVDYNVKVDMAELQIFTGVTLDTSVEANRRAFITSTGDPADMSLAQALLGQAPDIKLHGSNNWKTGLNTGSLGTNFAVTGTITAYTPNPGD